MKLLRAFLSWLIAPVVFTVSLQAQPVSSPPPIRAEFTVALADGSVPTSVFFLNDKGVEIPVAINSATRSPVYSYTGKPQLLFWGRDQSGTKRPVASVMLPPESRRLLILFVPNPAVAPDKPSHLAIATEDSIQNAPKGSLRILNLSGSELAMELGGRVSKISPGPGVPIPLASPGGPAVSTSLRLGQMKGEDVVMLYQGTLKVSFEERITMVALPGTSPDARGKVRILREIIREAPKPSPKPRP